MEIDARFLQQKLYVLFNRILRNLKAFWRVYFYIVFAFTFRVLQIINFSHDSVEIPHPELLKLQVNPISDLHSLFKHFPRNKKDKYNK